MIRDRPLEYITRIHQFGTRPDGIAEEAVAPCLESMDLPAYEGVTRRRILIGEVSDPHVPSLACRADAKRPVASL